MTKEHSEVLKTLLKPLEIDGDLDGILEIQGAALDEAQSDISYMEESIVPDILANEEIITRWEKLLEITSPFSTVFSERVDEIKRKLAIEGGINKDYFITLAEDLGFYITIEKPKYFFRAGISRANDPTYDPMLNFMALAGDIDYGLIASSDRSDEYTHIQHNDNLKNNRVYSSSSSVRQYVFKVNFFQKTKEEAVSLIDTFLKLKPGFSFFEWFFIIESDFEISSTTIEEGNPISFTWNGSGYPTSYEWYKKESESSEWILFSEEENPTTILDIGNWDIKLIASDENSTSTKELLNTITVISTAIQEFIMSGTTLASGTPQITLGYLEPQTGKTEFTIDWGDETSSTYTSAVNDLSIVHTYPSNSTDYTITITQAQMIDSLFCDWTDTDNLWIDSVDSWGVGFVQDSIRACFYNCTSLTTIPESWSGLENVTDMYNCFYNSSSLTTIPESWSGLENVTNIQYCFSNCSSLTTIPESWNGLENVTNMYNCFYNSSSLTSIPESWSGLENVTDMYNCFYNCTSLTTIPESWSGLENVTTMRYCFYNCTSLTTIPESWSGLENVTNVGYCFSNSSSLTSIPESWSGLENVTNIQYCFSNCSSLASIPITSLTSLSNVTNCYQAFTYATAVTSDILPVYNQLVTTAISFDGCFTGLTNATNYASIPTAWK